VTVFNPSLVAGAHENSTASTPRELPIEELFIEDLLIEGLHIAGGAISFSSGTASHSGARDRRACRTRQGYPAGGRCRYLLWKQQLAAIMERLTDCATARAPLAPVTGTQEPGQDSKPVAAQLRISSFDEQYFQ